MYYECIKSLGRTSKKQYVLPACYICQNTLTCYASGSTPTLFR